MDISEALTEYEKNLDEVSNLDAPLHEEMSFEEWKAYMEKRSRILFSCTSENETILTFLREYLSSPVKKEELSVLEEAYKRFYHRPEMEAAIMLPLGNAILNAHKEDKNTARIISYLYSMDNCINNALCLKCGARCDTTYSDELREFRKSTEDLKDSECMKIQLAYFNRLLVYYPAEYAIYKDAYRSFHSVFQEYEEEFLPKLKREQKNESFLMYDQLIHQASLSELTNMELFPENIVRKYLPLALEMYEDARKDAAHMYEVDSSFLEIYYNACLSMGERTSDELLEEAFNLYMENPLNSPSGNTEYECTAYNNSTMITKLARHATDKKRTSEIIKTVGRRVNEAALAYASTQGMMMSSRLIYLWTAHNLRFVGAENKITLIQNNIVKSQPATYIHSQMVKRISVLLFDSFHQKKPELFASLHMKFEELREYTGNAAILHDVGKIAISDVITTQSRRLLPQEFDGIKRHPELGLKLIDENPELSIYKDPVLYHHKWYNGEGGYPEGKDNVSSPYRIITDIITLSDCMDAATDNIGRCYKKSKTAYDVLEEFKASKGIKYNPDLVGIMEESPELMASLDRITGTERAQMMYMQYKDSLELEKNE